MSWPIPRLPKWAGPCWPIEKITVGADGHVVDYELGQIETEEYYKYEPAYECGSCGHEEASMSDLVIAANRFEDEAA